MKKLFFILTLSVSIFLPRNLMAQSLSLDSIAGFPDTVIDNEVVDMELFLSNSGGAIFNGDIAVLINAGTDSSGADTLFYNPTYSLSGNTFYDTINITHTFKASDFDGGDNIVVVWPVSSQLPVAVEGDSLTFNLFFKNVGIEENERLQSLHLYPNPSHNFIRLRIAHPEKVEQVRVFDVLGNVLMTFLHAVTSFSIESLPGGVYCVEISNRDQSKVVKKFLKE